MIMLPHNMIMLHTCIEPCDTFSHDAMHYDVNTNPELKHLKKNNKNTHTQKARRSAAMFGWQAEA